MLILHLGLSPAVQSDHRARLLSSEQRLRALRRQLNEELSEQWSEQADSHAQQVNAILATFGQPIRAHPRAAAQPAARQQQGSEAESSAGRGVTEDDEEDVQLSYDGEQEEHEEKGEHDALKQRMRVQQQHRHDAMTVDVSE